MKDFWKNVVFISLQDTLDRSLFTLSSVEITDMF